MGGALVTVNTELQVTVASQVLVTWKVTVLDPPQKSGGPELLLDNRGLQPPKELTSVNHSKYNESTISCEVHDGATRIGGQVRSTGGAGVTVKTAEH